MRRRPAILAFLFWVAMTVPDLAAAARWRQLGPDQRGLGQVLALAIDPSRPNRAFAGLYGGGIARSGDGGRTWRTMSDGIANPRIHSIVLHPALDRLVYVTGDRLIYRSLNGGRTWVRLSLLGVNVVVPDPRDPAVVWAGTDAGLFRSRDTGATWERLQSGLPGGYSVPALAIDPFEPRRIYAGVAAPSGAGLLVSENAGRSWTRSLRGVPFALYADLHAARTVYLLRDGRLQRSRDAGRTWELFFDSTLVVPPANAQALTMAADPQDPTIFFVLTFPFENSTTSIYRTLDAGRHWHPLTNGLPQPPPDARAVATAGGNTVLLGAQFDFGSRFGVFRSEDTGESWELSSRGLINGGVGSVAVTGSGALFASVFGDGVVRSLDGGGTWTRDSAGFINGFVTALIPDPHNPETLYAGTRFPFGPNPHIVWKTTDGGHSWTPLSYVPPESGELFALDATDLAVDPADPQTLFLATHINSAGLTAWGGIFRSRDGGQSWEKVGVPGSYDGVEVHPGAPDRILALSPLGVYRSTDGGDTWTQVLGRGDRLVRFLGIAPSDADVVYAAWDDGTLFRSLDGGAAFTPLGRRLPGIGMHTVAIDPLDSNTLVFAGSGSVVVRLTLGQGREVLREGLFGSFIRFLYFDPNDPLRLLAGTETAGLMEYRFDG